MVAGAAEAREDVHGLHAYLPGWVMQVLAHGVEVIDVGEHPEARRQAFHTLGALDDLANDRHGIGHLCHGEVLQEAFGFTKAKVVTAAKAQLALGS